MIRRLLRVALCWVALPCVVAWLWCSGAVAVSPVPVPLTAAEHRWGGFIPGAAIRTRTVAKVWQDGADANFLHTVSENHTVLSGVDDRGVTLQVFTMVGLAARRYRAAPTEQRLDFFQQPLEDENLTHEELPAVTIDIAGQEVECAVRLYRRKHPKWRQETLVYYTSRYYPHVMRTETTRWNAPTESEPREVVVSQTITRVVDTAAMAKRDQHLGTYTIELLKHQGETQTVGTLKCLCDVPGGVISETLRERDALGRIVREVETVLKGYSGQRATTPAATVSTRRAARISAANARSAVSRPLLPPETE